MELIQRVPAQKEKKLLLPPIFFSQKQMVVVVMPRIARIEKEAPEPAVIIGTGFQFLFCLLFWVKQLQSLPVAKFVSLFRFFSVVILQLQIRARQAKLEEEAKEMSFQNGEKQKMKRVVLAMFALFLLFFSILKMSNAHTRAPTMDN